MFIFKGDRTYLHSTDVLSFIENNYDFSEIDIKFYKLLRSQPKIKLTQNISNINKGNIVAKIKTKNFEKFLVFFATKKKIKNNYSFDEDLLIKFFKLNKSSVKCGFKTTVKYIDLIVSMSKIWHIKKIDKKKKWMVARISLKKKLSNSSKTKYILIKIKKIMSKNYTESDIFINKKLLGKIYYSAV